jgi:Raf kinase inhibitor-like YbhB/YbcL family protein
MTIQIKSTAFSEGEPIPVKHTCDGDDSSPPLTFSNIPPGAKSLVLICEDPDAPSGTFTHWILYDLPATVTELSGGVSTDETLSNSARQGKNDFKRVGYGGPCPPPNGPHHYFFRLYALDVALEVQPKATKDQITRAMEGHILGEGYLMGTYKRK